MNPKQPSNGRAPMDDKPTILANGKYLRLMRRGTWEYADRFGITGIVGIVAVTDEGKLLLVEQYRPAIDKYVIELPAGLVGDEPGQERESLLVAARRELQEETGYHADSLSLLAAGPTSAGISSEIITLVRATKLRKVTAGGGVEGEAIVVHEIPLTLVAVRLKEWIAEGKLVDLKVYAAQLFAADPGQMC
jgi:ADP-ribose pyrophosphatase